MILFIALVGMCVGSFLNVAALRIPRGESIVSPGSHCDTCGHALSFVDLFPVVSYLALRGRCRYCGASIGAQAPIAEVLFGAASVLLWITFGASASFALHWVIGGLLFLMALVDFRSHEVYDGMLIATGVAVILTIVVTGADWKSALPGVFIWIVFSLMLRDKMGDGDKILIAILLLSLPRFVQLRFFLYSIWSAAIVAVILLWKGASRKQELPFIPFIAIGYLAVLFFHGG